MIVKCKINSSMYEHRDGFEIKLYGLNFYYMDIKNENVRIIKDITIDKENLQHLCNFINSNDLDEIYIDDVIEDFLYKIFK